VPNDVALATDIRVRKAFQAAQEIFEESMGNRH
jgi:hypothetical protein